MSSFLEQDFSAIKERYKADPALIAKQEVSLHERVMQEQQTNSPRIPQDAANLALFDFAIAELKGQNGDGTAANVLYDSAIDAMKVAKKAGANVAGLEDVARHVRQSM